jgi:acyl carrier protein
MQAPSNTMDRAQILQQVARAIAGVKKRLRPADVRESASLADDLGLDSLDLAVLSAESRETFDDLDLTGWYVSVARSGSDTVASLVEFIRNGRQSR